MGLNYRLQEHGVHLTCLPGASVFGEAIVNILLSAYLLSVEQAGLVVGTHRWGQLRQSKVRY